MMITGTSQLLFFNNRKRSSSAAEAFPWSRLKCARTIELRQKLASHYVLATANLSLCALRRILGEAWRPGADNLLPVELGCSASARQGKFSWLFCMYFVKEMVNA
jgi:hypothetical protein